MLEPLCCRGQGPIQDKERFCSFRDEPTAFPPSRINTIEASSKQANMSPALHEDANISQNPPESWKPDVLRMHRVWRNAAYSATATNESSSCPLFYGRGYGFNAPVSSALVPLNSTPPLMSAIRSTFFWPPRQKTVRGRVQHP